MKPDNQESQAIQANALEWQHDVIRRTLQLKDRKQLPHALLIEMQTAVDSRSFGWQLVTSLLCEHKKDDAKPCGKCHNCELMRANNYPDFSFTTLLPNESTGKLNKDIKIDQIRRLIHQLNLTSNRHAGKYALIYPAEKMNSSAANSLLKTLEEPSNEAILILLTHHAGKLPVTIRSRCQHWTVNNPQGDVARNWLLQNGMDAQQVEEYLLLTRQDAQMALQLFTQQSHQHLQQIRHHIVEFVADRISVMELVQPLRQQPNPAIRLIIKNVIQTCIDSQLQKPLSRDAKTTLLHLLDLVKHADHVLMTEENNLNLQLQLEDVLISIKQILKRDTQHAFT